MLVLLQLVDVRRPRLIDLGRTGEPRLAMRRALDWSRFLPTGGKYMILSDWILQVITGQETSNQNRFLLCTFQVEVKNNGLPQSYKFIFLKCKIVV